MREIAGRKEEMYLPMKEFLSIREFSKFSGVSSSTLRYWDEIGLFSPAKRDVENNYRYYTPQQIIAVNFIVVLSSFGISLKTIGEIGKGRTPENVMDLIEQQEKLLNMEMRRLQECYSVIHTRRELINYGRSVMKGFKLVDGARVSGDTSVVGGMVVDLNKVFVMYRDEANFVMGPKNEFKKGEGFYGPFINFCKKAEDLRINLKFPIAGMHDNWGEFIKAPGSPNYFCSMDPAGNSKRGVGKYVVGYTRGYYGQFGDLPERMKKFIEENALTVTGRVYSLYLHDEVCIQDPSKYLVQVSVAVKGRSK